MLYRDTRFNIPSCSNINFNAIFLPNQLIVVGNAVTVQALDRPLDLQEFEASRISRHLAPEGDKVVIPTHRPPLPSGNTPSTHTC
jgi:hypothetical protein